MRLRFELASSRQAGDSSQVGLLRSSAPQSRRVSFMLAFKLAYTVFVLLVVVIWWRHYSWRNFLWFSDIAFIGAVPALWFESAALASVLAVAVLLPELLWNFDFVARIATRRRLTGLTDYMFEPERPRLLRGLSLFHVPLPLVLLWMVREYGYDSQAGLTGAVLLAAVVLPLSRAVSTPHRNINWTYGLGSQRSTLAPATYLALLYATFVVLVFLPTHVVLRALYGAQA